MIPERLALAQHYLDDAQFLLAATRFASAVSRAYYAAYQAMWAALGDPPRPGAQWRHGAIINHFVRGYWFLPTHPATGPGLLESLRFGLHRLYALRLNADYGCRLREARFLSPPRLRTGRESFPSSGSSME